MHVACRTVFIPGLILVLGILTGCAEPNEFAPPPPPSVTVKAPAVRDVTTFTDFTGRTEATETVEVRARVKGFLQSVNFEPSQLIARNENGDLPILFEIQPEQYEAAVDTANAAVAQAEAARALAQVKLDKVQVAFDREAATELEVRQFTAERDAAVANEDAANAALATAMLDLDYTKIRAPIEGRISREYVSVGNLVGGGENTLLTVIVEDNPMNAYFNVDERTLLQFLQNAERGSGRDSVTVRLQLANGVEYEHEGTVDFSENRVDPNTGTLQVRAVFPNEEGTLFPGLFGRVRLPQEVKGAVLVPDFAVQRDVVGSFVMTVDGENVVQRVDVEVGDAVDRERIITSGLDGTERVIVNGLQRARPGITVQPMEEGQASGPAPGSTPPSSDDSSSNSDSQ